MKITREQRINNTAANIVSTLNQIEERIRKVLDEGVDVKDNEETGQEALKATGTEIKKALGTNLPKIEQVLKLIAE